MKPVFIPSGRGRMQSGRGGNAYSLIHTWRNGQAALPNFPSLANVPLPESSFTLRIEKCIPVHESAKLPDQHFTDAWQRARDYVDRCRNHLGLGDYRQLLPAEVERLDRELPDGIPVSCYPIYFMTVCDPSIRGKTLSSTGQHTDFALYYRTTPSPDSNERVVYVGKTFGRHRFENGHHAITKLLRPEYEGLEKWLYLARLVYRQAGGLELPLEWIHERPLAEDLLGSSEGQLIASLDPELNDKDEPIRHHKNYAITNVVNRSAVLNGVLGFVDIDPAIIPATTINVVG
jgi:hypothetical protein